MSKGHHGYRPLPAVRRFRSLRQATLLGFATALFTINPAGQANGRSVIPKRVSGWVDRPILITGGLAVRPRKLLAVWPKSKQTANDVRLPGLRGLRFVRWSYTGDLLAALDEDFQLSLYRYTSSTSTFAGPLELPAVPWLKNREVSEGFDWSYARKILIDPDDDGISVCNLSNGRTNRIVPFLGREKPIHSVALSPDGRWIVFTTDGRDWADLIEEHRFQELWLIGVDGKGVRHLGRGAYPDWSPDSRQILAVEGYSLGGKKLLRYDVRTGRQRILLRAPLDEIGSAVFGPDGSQLAVLGAYLIKGSYQSNFGLHLADPNGRSLRPLYAQLSLSTTAPPRNLSW